MSSRKSRRQELPRAARPKPTPAAPQLTPPTRSSAWAYMALVFVALMALYAWTAPRSVVLEDDGEFIAAVHFSGVAHAPGYPLFTLLAKPFTWIPAGSVAFRVHLASGFFAALACAALWWVVRALTGRSAVALIAALAYGVSDAFWSQAIIADVYSLNALLYFAGIALCLPTRWHTRDGGPTRLGALAFVSGLGLSNHWPLFLLGAPAFVLLLWPVRRTLFADGRRSPLLPVILFLAGLLPYAWMVYRSLAAPDLAFSGAIPTFAEFRRVVSRTGYSAFESSATAGVADKLQFLGFVARETLWQFTPAGLAIAAAGLVLSWRRLRASIALALLVAFAGGTLLLVALLGWDYDFLLRAAFRVYPLIPYGIVAIWLGLGLSWSLDTLERRMSTVPSAVKGLVYSAGTALVAVLLVVNIPKNNRHDYTFARDYAVTLLESFEPNAVVFTHSDVDINTLSYFHFVEGMRPDIRMMNDQGLGISPDGRAFDPVALTPAQKLERLTALARETDRPVYFLGYAPVTLSDVDYGFYRRIDRTPRASATSTFRLDPRFVEYFRRVVTSPRPVDPWTIEHRRVVIRQLSFPLTAVVDFKGAEADTYRPDLERASKEFPGLLSRIQLLDRQKTLRPEQLLSLVERNETLADDTVGRADRAALLEIKARLSRTVHRN